MFSLIPDDLMQRVSLAVLLIYLGLMVPGGSSAAPPEVKAPAVTCNLPAELTTPDIPLHRVAMALSARGKVNVLAIGSGSTVGDSTGANGPNFVFHSPTSSFPSRMIEALQAAQPKVHFYLTVRGGRNMTAEAMLPVLQQEVAADHYDLVLWQTGTVEAVRGLRPDVMRSVLQDGIEAAERSGADVIVIDPQFSRFLRANADLGPYESALQQIVSMTGVNLFHRFDITQTWAGNGHIDLERVGRDDRDNTISILNVCLGRALEQFVLAGAEM